MPTPAEISEIIASVLNARADAHTREDGYYSGLLPTIRLSDQAIPLYKQIVEQSRTPWAQLVIDIASERMIVTGYRVITPDTGDDDATADTLAWDIWQSSQGDLYSQVAFRELLLHGRAYALVEPTETLPLISFESAITTAILTAPGGRQTLAAGKRWQDDTLDYLVLWLPEGAVTLSRDRSRSGSAYSLARQQLATSVPGTVPVFEMRNRPDLLGGVMSDLDGMYPTLDRICQGIADRVTAQLYSSTKARYLIGVEPEYNEDGSPSSKTLKLAVDKLLLIENPDAKVGAFEASDLRQFIEVSRSDISSLASLARLPVSLLNGDLVNLSAESLRSLLESLNARVVQRQTWAAPALSSAMRYALSLAGDTRVDDPRTRVEVVWAPVLPTSVADMASAASTLVQSNVLSSTAAQEWALSLTPSEIEKFRTYRRSDALDSAGVNVVSGLFAEPGTPTPNPAIPSGL